MTLNEIIEQLKNDHPEPYAQTNGVKYKMTGDELKAYYTESAQIIFDQKAKEDEKVTKEKAKTALLERLGITADEAALLA